MKTIKNQLLITTALLLIAFPVAKGNIFLNTTPENNNITSGLAGHYTFDGPHVDWGTAGAEILDTSGNTNTGQVVNMGPQNATWGKVGQGMEFNGSDEYIDLGNPASLQLSGSFSIAAWIYPHDLTGSKDIFVKTDGTGIGTDYTLQTYNNEIAFQFYNGGWENSISTTANLTVNQWVHIVGVFDDPSDEFRLYLNGNQIHTNPVTVSPLDTASNAYIGRGWAGQEWDGRLDDIRVYDRAITADEIASLYGIGNNKIGVIPADPLSSNLVAHWTMNGSNTVWSDTSTEIKDISGNTYHGDAISLSSSAAISGKMGQGLVFDGTSDYVNAGDITQLNSTDKFTITAWIRDDSHAQNDRVMGKFVDGSHDLNIATWGNGSLYVEIGNGENSYAQWTGYGASMPEGEWFHLAVVYDGTGALNTDRLNIYINGVNQTFSFAGTIPATTANFAAVPFYFGNDQGQYFGGALDDVRIYNTSLTPDQILSIYNSTGTNTSGTLKTYLSNGLMGYWTFDGSELAWGDTTSEAKDSIGTKHGDALGGMGTTNTIIGQTGQALSFDGVDDYISIPYSADFEPAQVSVQAWVRGGASVGNWNYILSKGADNCNNGSYALATDGSENLVFYIATAPTTTVSSPVFSGANIWDDTWHHVVGTYDGSNVRLYVDGAEVGSGTAETGSIAYNVATHSLITIGSYVGSCSIGIDADIDDVRVYNRALSASEVSSLYMNTK